MAVIGNHCRALGERCGQARWGLRRMGAVRPRKKAVRRDMARRALLRIDGRSVEVTLQLNRRARRLIVKVHPSTGEVTVVAPSKRAFSEALDFARTESDWISRRLKNVPRPVEFELGARIPLRGEMHVIRRGEERNRPVWVDRSEEEPIIRVSGWGEHTERRVFDFLKREARKSFDQHVMVYADMIGVRPRASPCATRPPAGVPVRRAASCRFPGGSSWRRLSCSIMWWPMKSPICAR